MNNGGQVGSRGYIFQSIIALIECLERDDWDEIKIEPPTDYDKVDIQLYTSGEKLSAIQVKSSTAQFEKWKVEDWLELTRMDAADSKEVCLCLVGDTYSGVCRQLINEEPDIKTRSFAELQRDCAWELLCYIKRQELGGQVRVDDLESIYNSLFASLMMNGIAERRISRSEFEKIFRNAIPAHLLSEIVKEALNEHINKSEPHYPKRLTPIPFIDPEVGLVGRENIIKDVRRMLEEKYCIVLVSGLGGIGKTAVMQEVCNDLLSEGNYVAWVSCGDSLRDDMLMLRGRLGIPETDSAEAAYEKVIEKIGRAPLAGKLYLFLDDLSRKFTNKERSFLHGLEIHVMVTSRQENLHLPKLKLTELAEQYAIEMFYRYYRGDQERRCFNSAKEIVNNVRRHTLLIELLAKAAWKAGGTLDDFLGELENRGIFDVFEGELEFDDENLTIEECVIRLYKMSRLSKDQKHVMELFTIFSPEKPIYDEVRKWAGFDINVMSSLVDLGWLDKVESGYVIHQIVRDALRKQIGEVRLEDYGEFLDKVIDTDGYLGQEVTYDKVRERLVLIEDVARFFDKSGREDEDTGNLFHQVAGVYKDQVDYGKAIEYYGKALAIYESVLGTDHPYTATTYNNMAVVYHEQGDYGKALEYYGKDLAIVEHVLGTDHPSMVAVYNNIAGVYHAQGDYGKALEYYRKALAISERLLGLDHPDTATMYGNMATVYCAQGDYGKSLEYYGKALSIRERVLGREHPDTASTYNNMALVYSEQGDYGKALGYNRKALAISERVLGPDHPDTATTYNNMAIVYNEQGDYGKALEYYGKALVIVERVLGPDHPDTAVTYNNMVGVYRSQGDYRNALEYCEKALAISERVLGTDHPSTAATYNNMAGIYYLQGDYAKALEYYGKALAVSMRALGPEHPNTATTYNNIAGVYHAQGDYEKALEYYGKDLAIVERVLGPDHPDTATTYNNMASVYNDQGDYEMALEYYGKALSIRERVLGTDHPSTATTYYSMASMFHDQGDYEKTLDYLKKANMVYLSVFGENHQYTQDTAMGIKIMEMCMMTGMTEDELMKMIKNHSTK